MFGSAKPCQVDAPAAPALMESLEDRVMLAGDVTYIGTFNERYSVQYAAGKPAVNGSFGFRVTIKMRKMVSAGGVAVYTITSVRSSAAFFGAQFAVRPRAASVATLPNPPRNLSNMPGQGFVIRLPNGATLTTNNAAGAMHQSSDNRTISNSLNKRFPVTWYAVKGGRSIEKTVVNGGRYYSLAVIRSTWAFVRSAT